jgi:hypothetical protein
MFEEASALSPAPPAAATGSEADYQALVQLLSMTAKGRWFLSEFAKRNRNAETSKMLDAVARIEQSIAVTPEDPGSQVGLDAVRTWVVAARDAIAAQLSAPDRRDLLANGERGVLIIREVAQSMRAIGNDPRICNILDRQIVAIETAQRATHDIEPLLDAFDQLVAQIEALAPAARPAAEALTIDLGDPSARLAAVADLARSCASGEAIVMLHPVPPEDEELLDRIAAEMMAEGEPEPSAFADDEEPSAPQPAATQASETSLALDAARAHEPEQASELAEAAEPTPAPEPAEASGTPPAQDLTGKLAQINNGSLGASLLASGLVVPAAPEPENPFAPLKRLSQAELMALFT